jgi:hypothetical protein
MTVLYLGAASASICAQTGLNKKIIYVPYKARFTGKETLLVQKKLD